MFSNLFSKEQNGSTCEVKGLNNTLLGTGTLRTGSADSKMIEVQDDAGHLPPLAVGTKVRVLIHSRKGGTKVVEGKVDRFGSGILRVRVTESLAEHEKRRFFRQSTDHSATLLSPRGMLDAGGEEMPPKLPVRVKDVSLCGLLIESPRPLSVGDGLQIRMTLMDNELETIGISITRLVREQEGKFYYGCEIVGITPRLEQRINAFVLEQQRQQIRRSRR